MLGRVDVLILAPERGPTERLYDHWLRPQHGAPVERVCAGLTVAGCRDAVETLQALYDDNANKLDLDGAASFETKALVKEQAALCGVISLLYKRIGGANAEHDRPDHTSNDDEGPAPAGQRGPRS